MEAKLLRHENQELRRKLAVAQERIAALESQGEAKKPGHRTDSAVHDQDKKKLDSGKSHA